MDKSDEERANRRWVACEDCNGFGWLGEYADAQFCETCNGEGCLIERTDDDGDETTSEEGPGLLTGSETDDR